MELYNHTLSTEYDVFKRRSQKYEGYITLSSNFNRPMYLEKRDLALAMGYHCCETTSRHSLKDSKVKCLTKGKLWKLMFRLVSTEMVLFSLKSLISYFNCNFFVTV